MVCNVVDIKYYFFILLSREGYAVEGQIFATYTTHKIDPRAGCDTNNTIQYNKNTQNTTLLHSQ